MAEFRLKKGFDLRIAGKPEEVLAETPAPQRIALKPHEFLGIKAKIDVKAGDAVKRGTPLFHCKVNHDIKFVSPISGTVKDIVRGERRMVLCVVVENDNKNETEPAGSWTADDAAKMDREQLIANMLKGGVWPYIIQRPFGKIAKPADMPRDIFISGMNTAPLAADPNFLLQGEEENFQFGLDVLKKLTDGKVYLSLDGNGKKTAPAFEKASGVEKNTFKGKHPAGNVGVHIHHIKPLGRGELVWQVDAFGVANIGKFFKTGVFPAERIIAAAGSSLKERKYFKTILGAPIADIIPAENIIDKDYRVIIGNVLTGRKTYTEGFVSFYRNTITVIPEGKKARKLLGYFRPGFGVTSFSKTFASSFLSSKSKEYEIDTLINGGKRAFVMSASDYEQVVPMDILPVPLMKAIMVEDIEEMEGLGILELIEEDVALCSYMDLSKHDFGKILRDGLYVIEREL